MIEKKYTCVLYARQSSGDDERSESVDLQLARLKAMAASRGWTVIGEYSDLDISGKCYPDTVDARALSQVDTVFREWSDGRKDVYRRGLGELMGRLNEADAVLVWDITRLMRPLRGSYLESYIVQRLKMHHCKVIQLDGGEVDFSSFENSLIVTITSMINDNQLKIQREKQMGAYKAMRDRGQQCSGPAPLGYRRERGTMVVDTAGAEAMREAYRLCLNGDGISRICRQLNGKYRLNVMPSNLKKMLKRPVYAGLAYNSDGDLIPASPSLPIVSEADWRRAQLLLSGKTHGYVRKRINALSGLMRCGYCGGAMNVVSIPTKKGDKALTLKCNRVDQGVATNDLCRVAGVRYRAHDIQDEATVDVPAEPFDRHAMKSLATVGIDPSWRSIGLHEALMPLCTLTLLDVIRAESDKGELAKEQARLEMSLQKTRQNKGNIATLVGDGLMSLDDARSKLESLADEERSLSVKLAEVASRLASSSRDDLAKAYALIYMIKEGTLPTSQYRVLAHKVFRKITCYAACVVVEMIDGTAITIEKIRRAGVMTMPPYRMDLVPLSDGSHRLEISYYYSSYFAGKDDLPNVIAMTDRLKVYSIGHNNRPEGKDGIKSKLMREGWDRDHENGLV